MRHGYLGYKNRRRLKRAVFLFVQTRGCLRISFRVRQRKEVDGKKSYSRLTDRRDSRWNPKTLCLAPVVMKRTWKFLPREQRADMGWSWVVIRARSHSNARSSDLFWERVARSGAPCRKRPQSSERDDRTIFIFLPGRRLR